MRAAVVTGLVLWLGSASAWPVEVPAGTSYGGGVTLDESTPLQALLAAPQEHLGQVIRVDGVVTEICREHGDWLKVSVPRGGSGILVLLVEGLTVPGGGVAHRVAVEGVLVAGPDGEPHACPAMTRGEVRYHLRGTGVVVH